MALPIADAVARLEEDARWRARFEKASGAAPSRTTLARALSAFVERLTYGNSRVDRFQDGEFEALSAEERAGLWFYESRGNCWRCHSGPNFTDEEFHNSGIGARDDVPAPGRSAVTRSDRDQGRFKTPTLRGLSETGPYMHDGSLATLEEVVAFYRRGGNANSNLDPDLGPIEMDDQDARNLAAFLRALSRKR